MNEKWIKTLVDGKIDMNIGIEQEYDEAIRFIEKR